MWCLSGESRLVAWDRVGKMAHLDFLILIIMCLLLACMCVCFNLGVLLTVVLLKERIKISMDNFASQLKPPLIVLL